MLIAIVSMFLACGEKEDTGMPDGIDCTAEFRYSATINVSDLNGDPLASEFVEVYYTVDGVEGQYVESWEPGAIIVGGEESGDFVVTLSAEVPQEDPCCSAFSSTVLGFTIEADECHVIPQTFDANLDWYVECESCE